MLKQISFIVVLMVLYLIGMHELLKGIIFGFFLMSLINLSWYL